MFSGVLVTNWLEDEGKASFRSPIDRKDAIDFSSN